MDVTTLLLPMALKGLALAALVVAACSALRHARGAVVHTVLAALFGALVALPLLQVAGPIWTVRVATGQPDARAEASADDAAARVRHTWPEGQTSTAVFALSPYPYPTAGLQAPRAVHGAAVFAPPPVLAPVSSGPTVYERAYAQASRLASAGWLPVFAWGAGVLLVALYWTLALASAAQLVRAAQPVADEDWLRALARAQQSLGHTRAVRLLRSSRVSTPFAWGFGRPAVILPPSSGTWSEDARAAVLEHEVAHLARRDPQVQLLAQAALALHWFNPFAWAAYRRLLLAREQACDDAALAAGVAPSAYAGLLLSVARLAQAPAARPVRQRMALSAVSSMARPSDLERRIVAVLRPDARRGEGPRRVRVMLGLSVVAALLPLAAFRPVLGATVLSDTTGIVRAEMDGPRTEARASARVPSTAPQAARPPASPETDLPDSARETPPAPVAPRPPSPPEQPFGRQGAPAPPPVPLALESSVRSSPAQGPTRTSAADIREIAADALVPPAAATSEPASAVDWDAVTAARLAAEASRRD